MLKSGIYDFVICRGGTDMCFILRFGRKRPDLKQYRISGLTVTSKLSLVLSLDFSPLRPIGGVSQIPAVLYVPPHQLGMLFISEHTFQPWYYRSIPHHL